MTINRETGSGPPSNGHRAARKGATPSPFAGPGSRSGIGTSIASTTGSERSRSPGPNSSRAPATARRGTTAPPQSTASHPSGASTSPSSGPGSGALYRYRLLPGNESVLLRQALERRPWWAPVSGPAVAASSAPSRKDRGTTKGGGGSAPTAAATGAAQAPEQQQQQQMWNLWAGLNGQRFSQFDLLQPGGAGAAAAIDPSSRRLVNRLPEHRVICTKSGLAAVLEAIKAVATATAAGSTAALELSSRSGSASGSLLDLSWIPETYVVPAGPKAVPVAGVGSGALGRFKAAFARHAAAGRRVWIAKPTCLNRGNGIEVYGSLDRILEHLRSRPAGSSLILQKYIERPLLLGGRKFDIRAYVLVGPDGGVWFHKEAYCRTSSTPYDSSNLSNRSAHLTNDAVQKHLDSYNDFEDHCKMSLQELGPALSKAAAATPGGTAGGPASSCASLELDTAPGSEDGLWGGMRRCVAALFSCAAPQLNPRLLGHCFELLGLDFMLDEQGALSLIEVNTSPALFRAGAYLADLLPRLVEEVVQRAVDPLFPPPPPQQQQPHDPQQQRQQQQFGEEQAGVGTAAEMRLPPPLDGFVRVQLDEQLGAAVAAATAAAGRVGRGSTGSPALPGRGGVRAKTAAAASRVGAGVVAGISPVSRAADASVAVGGVVRLLPRI